VANKIKNKYEAPKSTEFTPRDLIVDVKNGHLYYKSNYAVYRVTGTLFSTNVEVITDLSIGLADNTQVLFNNNSTIDGLTNFTISNVSAAGAGTVNIGSVNIDGGTLDGISSFTVTGNIDIGNHDFRANNLTADSLTSGRVVFAGTNGTLIDDSAFTFNSSTDVLTVSKIGAFTAAGAINFDSQNMTNVDINSGTVDGANINNSNIGHSTQCDVRFNADAAASTSNNVHLGCRGPANSSNSSIRTALEIQSHVGRIIIGKSANAGMIFENQGPNGALICSTNRQTNANSVKGLAIANGTDTYTLSTANSLYNSHTNTSGGHNKNLKLTCNQEGYNSTQRGAIKLLNGLPSSAQLTQVEIKGGVTIASAHTVGNMKASGDVVAFSSDRRLKENITNIKNPLSKLNELRGVYFDWNDFSKTQGFRANREKNEIGMIAQEVEKVIPQAIYPAPFNEKYKTIQYDRLIPLLVECIKEQQKQIDNLKKQIK
jgi:hypothetical protein